MYILNTLDRTKLTKEEWIDRKVEQLLEQDTKELIEYPWFEDCVDWDKVHSYLIDIAEEEFTDLLTEQQINNWENNQLEEY